MSSIKSFVERNKSWLRKVGIAGFLFFLLKGIAWLVVGYLVLR
jgi:DMSO reductase anchor subunit